MQSLPVAVEGFLQLSGNKRAILETKHPVRMAIAVLLFYVLPSLAHRFRSVAFASTVFVLCVGMIQHDVSALL